MRPPDCQKQLECVQGSRHRNRCLVRVFKGHAGGLPGTAENPQKADGFAAAPKGVSHVPIPDLARRHYWRTCVARPNIEMGIVTLSALAVWRFAPSSKSLGLPIGRSPGLAPFRI